jgi:hypothetical protein
MDLMQILTSQLGGNAVSQISEKLGVDSGTAQAAITAGLPLLMSALAKNSSTPEGADKLHQALNRDHDGSVLNDIGGFLGGGNAESTGAGILKHVLGGSQAPIQNALGQSTGLNGGQVGQVLAMLAPVVMGAIGQQTKQQGFDASSLAGFLGNQQQAAANASPDLMSIAIRFLDSNGNGSIMDEAAGLLGSFLKK